jgi:hypothetical protein
LTAENLDRSPVSGPQPVLSEDGLDHYGIAMQDPEGNEFDIN